MKLAAVLLALSPLMASAFVTPATTPKAATTSRTRGIARMVFSAQPGAVKFPPNHEGYWDPLGLSADGDEDKFNRYRAIEIKHGRVAQLAALHYIVTYWFKLPGSLGDVPIADIPSGLAAIKAVPAAGWAQILLFASALELLAPQKPDRIPGDVQPDTDAFKKLEGKTQEEFEDYQTKELNNGRLAQIAIAGIWVGELLTNGQHPIDTFKDWLA